MNGYIRHANKRNSKKMILRNDNDPKPKCQDAGISYMLNENCKGFISLRR